MNSVKLKKIVAGSYSTEDGIYYAVRMEDNGWWTVGEHPGNHIEDFKTLRDARAFIKTQY